MTTESLSTEAQRFIDDFACDHEVVLVGIETEERDFHESPYSVGHPDNVRYATTDFTRLTFMATGFVWTHPHGAVISGEFPKPIKAYEVEIDDDGEKIDSNGFNQELRAAIVAKCGKIAGYEDSLLVLS